MTPESDRVSNGDGSSGPCTPLPDRAIMTHGTLLGRSSSNLAESIWDPSEYRTVGVDVGHAAPRDELTAAHSA